MNRQASSLLAVLLIGLTGSIASPAIAVDDPADPADPAIRIESDRMEYDDKARTNVFSGNVVLIRGEMEIRATQLKLTQDAEGNQVATATGKPARFVQRRTGADLRVEGQGRELRYKSQTQEVEIIGSATLLRSLPGQPADRVSGARIVYQSNNNFFTVEGGKEASSQVNPRGRVQVVIQPRNKGKQRPAKNGPKLVPARSLARPKSVSQ